MTSMIIDQIDSAIFREVCARWVTGVAVVTSTDAGGQPVGLSVNSFTSLSLDPPLVLFCAASKSTTWPSIAETGRFCVNVLSSAQEPLVRSFARAGADKFSGVDFAIDDYGLPTLTGSVARLVCTIESLYPGGDHEIVVGRVHALDHLEDEPLIFHRGKTRPLNLTMPAVN